MRATCYYSQMKVRAHIAYPSPINIGLLAMPEPAGTYAGTTNYELRIYFKIFLDETSCSRPSRRRKPAVASRRVVQDENPRRTPASSERDLQFDALVFVSRVVSPPPPHK